MNKLWYVVGAVFITSGLLLSCGGGGGEEGDGGDEGGNGGAEPPGTGTLTIRNLSSVELELVHWMDDYGYIYFWISVLPDFFRTDELVSVNAGDAMVFTFTDETMVWKLDEGEGIMFDIDDAVRVPSDVNDRRAAAREAEKRFEKSIAQ